MPSASETRASARSSARGAQETLRACRLARRAKDRATLLSFARSLRGNGERIDVLDVGGRLHRGIHEWRRRERRNLPSVVRYRFRIFCRIRGMKNL